MSQVNDPRAWWDLHLRKARGETLSEQEQQLYDADVARQDREALPLRGDLESLKEMRAQVRSLTRSNTNLQSRLTELDQCVEQLS